MSQNPYPTRQGFGWSQEEAGMYTRGFDGCFENYDGDAVVWQIMREAQTDETLSRGVRRMGEKVWPQWHAIYTASLLNI